MEEIWKPIKGFESYYEVSDLGNIRRNGNMLKQMYNKQTGYFSVTLSVDGKTTRKYTHRLVAMAFIPNPENKPQVNHKDCNKTNNVVINLEWATNKENNTHAWANGINYHSPTQIGEGSSNHKLTNADILEIRRKALTYSNHKSIAAEYGVARSTISRIVKKTYWSHI